MNWINEREATDYRIQLEDMVMRGFLTYCWQVILTSRRYPQGDFDVLYFTKIMERVRKEPQTLLEILDGKPAPKLSSLASPPKVRVRFCRQKEASSYRLSIKDPIVRKLVGYTWEVALSSTLTADAEVDALCFVLLTREVFKHTPSLRNALEGKFVEDDFDGF